MTRSDFKIFDYIKSLAKMRIILGICLLVIFLTSYWFWLDYRMFLKQGVTVSTQNQIYRLEKGTSINRLANQLAENGQINHSFYLKIFVKLNPEYSQLKAGEYKITTALTPKELLTVLISGKVVQYSFTIIEGQTYYQVLNNLEKEKHLKPLTSQEIDQLLEILNIDAPNIEGWFFPETYNFDKGETAIALLKRASSEMKTVLANEWNNRANDLPYDSAYEALIMASIIEKETGIASERAEIAGVFVRRLNKKMRLQTDPTVIYGIGPDFNGDITRKDLKTPTPYNTYTIKALPPTPIAMPSRESIHAALNPRAGNTLYFVADGTGGHYFSETLQEHQKAVRRMLKRNRNR